MINYRRSFPRGSYFSSPLPYNVLKESEDGSYSLVPFVPLDSAKASDYSIRSQIRAGIPLKPCEPLQPLTRSQAADYAGNVMLNLKSQVSKSSN